MIRTPYLIQRGLINRPLAVLRIGQAINLDYMGSAEFEFGALPKSLRELQAKKDSIKITKELGIQSDDRCLRALHTFDPEEYDEYARHLLDLRAGKTRTKESTHFAKDYQSQYNKTDFWWDIDNHVMFCFDKIFMNRLVDCLNASWSYMDEQKGKQ